MDYNNLIFGLHSRSRGERIVSAWYLRWHAVYHSSKVSVIIFPSIWHESRSGLSPKIEKAKNEPFGGQPMNAGED